MDHFLFRYKKWTAYRIKLFEYTNTYKNSISLYLKKKSPSDKKDQTFKWRPFGGTIEYWDSFY